jgi:beta-lactamase superfamily II metal-dependent hydrolase
MLPVSGTPTVYELNLRVDTTGASFDTTVVFTSSPVQHDLLKVHFINVQQGDAILVQTPDGKNVQIDGGYGTFGNSTVWQGGGVPIALNYLVSQNVTHLNYMIETHAHLDHYGGLVNIRNSHITYGQQISNAYPRGYVSGSYLILDSPVTFQFLNVGYPPTYNPQNPNVNNSSIVVRMAYQYAEFLFTGDAEGVVLNWIFNEGFNLSADVLKVSHHGATSNNTNNSTQLARTLNQYAKIAILSYGENNIYGHPLGLDRYTGFQTYGTNVISNPPQGSNFRFNCGHIVVKSDGKMIYVTTER